MTQHEKDDLRLSTEQVVADYGDGTTFENFFDLPQFRVEAVFPHTSLGEPGWSKPSYADSGSLEAAHEDLKRLKAENPTAVRWGIAKIEYVTRTSLLYTEEVGA